MPFSETTYSEPANEIIQAQPGKLVMHAGLVFLVILCLLFVMAALVPYPEKVLAKATLQATNPPLPIAAKAAGRLQLFISDTTSMVQQGSLIGCIENSANLSSVLSMSTLLDSIANRMVNDHAALTFKPQQSFNKLGDLQMQWEQFDLAWNNWLSYTGDDGLLLQQKQLAAKDIIFLKQQQSLTNVQQKLAKEDLMLADSTFNSQTKLLGQKVIAPMEWRQEKSKWIARQNNVAQLDAGILANNFEQHQKGKELHQWEIDKAQRFLELQQALQTLRAAVDSWKLQYLLLAPSTGKLVLAGIKKQGIFLGSSETLGWVLQDSSKPYILIQIPQSNFGKVQLGQQVSVKLDAYPWQQYGMLDGRVEEMGALPTDSGYHAIVSLPKGLVTRSEQQLQFRNGFTGTAEIRVKEQTLLQKLLQETRKLFQH